MTEKKPHTHTAYAKKREGRTTFRMLAIGAGRVENDGSNQHVVYVDLLPLGGFDGQIYLYPIGVKPEEPEPQPRYPGEHSDGEDI